MRKGIQCKTLPNVLCGCLKTSAVATPEWEQPKEEADPVKEKKFKLKEKVKGKKARKE